MGLVVVIVASSAGPGATAEGKLSAYASRLIPTGDGSGECGQSDWGGAIYVVFPIPLVGSIPAGVFGAEFTRFLNDSEKYVDKTGANVERKIDQDYIRFYLGFRIARQGNRSLRPFVGINLAVIDYGIGIDETIQGYDHEVAPVTQDVFDQRGTSLGFDLSAGAEMVLFNIVSIEAGSRYMRSFSPVKELGEHAVRISREYFQFYVGAGILFDVFKR